MSTLTGRLFNFFDRYRPAKEMSSSLTERYGTILLYSSHTTLAHKGTTLARKGNTS